MNAIKENKGVLIIAVIAILLLTFYMMGNTNSQGGNILLSSQNALTENVDDRELLQLLIDMRNIRLDGAIFESDIYKSLQDFSKPIVPEPVGRTDPFAPLPKTEVIVTGGGDLRDQVLLR